MGLFDVNENNFVCIEVTCVLEVLLNAFQVLVVYFVM